MKLIITVLRDQDNDAVSAALIEANFRVTRIASTGGLLRRGSSTLLVGVEDENVDQAIAIIRSHVTPAPDPSFGRVILFVLNVEKSDYI